MDWQNKKRSSVSYSPLAGSGYSQRGQMYGGNSLSPTTGAGNSGNFPMGLSPGNPENSDSLADRSSFFFSQYPLYCADWKYIASKDLDCIALSTYKEGLTNKLQIVHGQSFREEPTEDNEYRKYTARADVEGFDFRKTAEISLDYPITNLQWDPLTVESQRLAALLEALRLYKVDQDYELGEHKVYQTHLLANNTNGNGAVPKDDINTFPPVTSFDWNKTDPNIIIASLVNTTCTVWDLNRSHSQKSDDGVIDTATVKTQLIAHDSEVFDVKFVHKSSDIFVSVGNDGSMRLFDLRSLEHSTIIYEPTAVTNKGAARLGGFNQKALLKLSTSNVEQHYLATIGVNSNQIIVIDMRMPGMPLVTLDGLLGGACDAAINLILWHPSSNYLLSGGDDCNALVWDCSQMTAQPAGSPDFRSLIDTPILAYEEELEVNNVCWRQGGGDWMGVVSGRGFQAVGT